MILLRTLQSCQIFGFGDCLHYPLLYYMAIAQRKKSTARLNTPPGLLCIPPSGRGHRGARAPHAVSEAFCAEPPRFTYRQTVPRQGRRSRRAAIGNPLRGFKVCRYAVDKARPRLRRQEKQVAWRHGLFGLIRENKPPRNWWVNGTAYRPS